MRAILAGCLLLLLPSLSSAQTPGIPLNTAGTVVFTHTGAGTDGYRLFVDGVKVGADVLASAVLVKGEVRLPLPPQTVPGAHVLAASAYGPGGETRSPDVAFFVGAPPALGPIRIEIISKVTAAVEPQPDGSFTVRIDGVQTSATVIK